MTLIGYAAYIALMNAKTEDEMDIIMAAIARDYNAESITPEQEHILLCAVRDAFGVSQLITERY
jgi:hypothetical protein